MLAEIELHEAAETGMCQEIVASWSDDDWMQRLRRFAEIGSELEMSGADACEAKVRQFYTVIPIYM